MSELFSNERLVDYFALVDVEISNIDRSLNSDVFDKLSQSFFPEASPCLKIDYNYKIKNIYPKKDYKDYYTLNFDTFFPLMPEERVYLTERPNSSYSFIIPNDKGKCYYVFFYKVYLPVNKTNESISKIKEFDNGNISLYAPKYLCFISLHPFFVSFKKLLEDIFNNSVSTKNNKCFKIENILNIILYRIYLPKYQTTQICFCLGDNVYNFVNNKFKTEIGFKFFFSKISIDNTIILLISMLLNSIIVIFHSDLEVIAPFIYLLTQLLYPLPMTYSIVNNLTPDHVELLSFNGGLIAGVYKNDFSDLSSIMKENFTHIVYYDIDQNMLMIDSNEILKEKKIVPIEKMKTLIGRVTQILHMKSDNDLNINYIIDCNIRSAFFDFISQIFSGVNLDKHMLVNKDSSELKVEFDYDGFIKDSIVDYYPLLDVVRTSACVKAFIANMKSYYVGNKKKINFNSGNGNSNSIKDIDEDITLFFKGIDKRKKGKTTEGLFMVNIFNTITISSPAYEKLSYKQNNIFVDDIHDEIFKHSSAVNFITSNSFSLNNYLINAQKKDIEASNVIRAKPVTGNSNSNSNNTNAIKSTRTNQLPLSHQSNQLSSILNQYLLEFKEHLTFRMDLLKEYYGLVPNSYLLEALRSSNILFIQQPSQSSSTSMPSEPAQLKNTAMPSSSSSSHQALIPKSEYIESFNKVIKAMNFKGEFHINFASNVLETHCICPSCNKPNNIWDIRKTFNFSKARRETRSICKYCCNYYIPYFKAICQEEVLSSKTKKIETVYTQKRSEYMAFEHLGILLSEGEISKKVPANLYNNIGLEIGEIKCVIDDNIKLYSIESFIRENDSEYNSNKGNALNNKNVYLLKQNSKETGSMKNVNFSRSKTNSSNERFGKRGR